MEAYPMHLYQFLHTDDGAAAAISAAGKLQKVRHPQSRISIAATVKADSTVPTSVSSQQYLQRELNKKNTVTERLQKGI
jgi:hypothetical protein